MLKFIKIQSFVRPRKELEGITIYFLDFRRLSKLMQLFRRRIIIHLLLNNNSSSNNEFLERFHFLRILNLSIHGRNNNSPRKRSKRNLLSNYRESKPKFSKNHIHRNDGAWEMVSLNFSHIGRLRSTRVLICSCQCAVD